MIVSIFAMNEHFCDKCYLGLPLSHLDHYAVPYNWKKPTM